jgi:hypothetical protein
VQNKVKMETKFRAFDDGKMIYQNETIMTNDFDQLSWFFKTIRKDAIVMKSIGIEDVNKKDVYVGDFVKGRYSVYRSMNPDAQPEITTFDGEIYYTEGVSYVRADNGQCVFSFSYSDYELEVYGNKFEGVA